ncbi:EcoAI/FtnUII family type I restriction enzme subunit R [Microbispora amethystogenes]|uniref:Type I restriction enzyme EcoAI R protein n=1 Tax=Microbispora amethystogenes TaxID=1427754 RepID=A0ABQ4FL28_9ACTN|nr:type I restriction endonuclease subunit R [Microbispora amethystogenes]GIH35483.1 type I restriction enzyme EcoAI R protein [Microbispora amethystogenes]
MASASHSPNEGETRRILIERHLKQSGWNRDQIVDEYPITDGQIMVAGGRPRRKAPLRADYVLEYRPGLPVAVIEAKRTSIDPGDGIEQVKRYAKKLQVPFAYVTNGLKIQEVDRDSGKIADVGAFPSPEQLWARYRRAKGLDEGPGAELVADLLLAPFDESLLNWDRTLKVPRYYQRLAVQHAVEAIGRGRNRVLLVLATGTGKTMVAYQLVKKLARAGWVEGRQPKVLYLADRNILVDQPKDDYFIPGFGEAVHKLGGGVAKLGRHIYFALYQSLEKGKETDGDDKALFEKFDPDYFDLVIVDECHRGSAKEDSNWRKILKYFDRAVQIGLTATPVRERDADTFEYFRDPVYEYSLKEGIEDGFLAPYRVRRVNINVDAFGWRPEPGQVDKYGALIPDRVYTQRDFERVIAIVERTEEAARYLTDLLHETGRMNKTIVFCVDSDHANRMRTALHNANADLSRQYGGDYVVRITSRDGQPGLVHLDEFKKVDSETPVIAVTAKLLSTGVDMPTVRNIVLFRPISSMAEFKQIIGRGTRLFGEGDKFSFDIIDFVYATRYFDDPEFDGPPIKRYQDTIDDQGRLVDREDETPSDGTSQVAEPGFEYREEEGGELPPPAADLDDEDLVSAVTTRARRLYVDGQEVFVYNDTLYVLDESSRPRVIEYRLFARDQVRRLYLSPGELRGRWARARSRSEILRELDSRGIDVNELAKQLHDQDADPLDLLLAVAWELPRMTRQERARRVRREHRAFLESFAEDAQGILELILDKYAEHGPDQLVPAVLQVYPFTDLGSAPELAARFGGKEGFREALDRLGRCVYDAA